ncbi:MAG: hypothetical protein HFJ37_05380 [Clostridia bacterium]|nr:hypothetical protein [Clostridia bacterium]
MKNKVLKEVKKELNWKEKIIIKIFKKTFSKIYDKMRIVVVNKLLK